MNLNLNVISKKTTSLSKHKLETLQTQKMNKLLNKQEHKDLIRNHCFSCYPKRNLILTSQENQWQSFINIDTRVKKIKELISKEFSHENLVLVDALLKSASIGIIPKDDNKILELREDLLNNFSKQSFDLREKNYEVFNSIYKEIPLHKKIKNRGPMRHGILGFKDHVVRGDKWEKLGEAGDFPRTLHQLAHQVPALELGYICKAYAQYLRTNANMDEFDRVLKENGVNFEEYFVKNAKRIAENAGKGKRWNQISSEKPKGLLRVSDEDIKKAFSHRDWTGKNVDELMVMPGNKTANFFDVYGDIVIETLKSYGFSIFDNNKELEKTLKPEDLSILKMIDQLRNKIDDKSIPEEWKNNHGIPSLLQFSTHLRKVTIDKVFKTNDTKKLRALVSLDNDLESVIDTVSIKILSNAPKNDGLLYKLDKKTQDLFLVLMENYSLRSSANKQELSLLKRDLIESFNNIDKNSKVSCERLMVPLNRLDRLVQKISKDISDKYRPIALELAKNNTNEKNALQRVEQLADGMLRGSLLFPISQIYNGFKSEVKRLIGASPWQIVSVGEKIGKIIFADNMEHLEEIANKSEFKNEKLICFVDTLLGAEEPPKGVYGIITPKVVDTLAHIGVRARQEGIGFACVDDYNLYQQMKKGFSSMKSYAKLSIKHGKDIKIEGLTKEEYEALVEEEKKVDVKPEKVILPKVNLEETKNILNVSEIKMSKSGPKATNIAKLSSKVPIPPSFSIPFGVFRKVLNHPDNKEILKDYKKVVEVVNKKQKDNNVTVNKECEILKKLVKKLVIPREIEKDILNTVTKALPTGTKFVMTRSSTNGEDLENFSGAGLYSSQPNPVNDISSGIKTVWASKWNKRALDARVKAQIPHDDLNVAVLIQPCINTKYGFVTHTVNPLTKNSDEVFIEMVQGQNEALVSGKIPGTGYGFLYNKKTGSVTRTHLADKSYQFLPSDDGGTRIELADYKNDILAGDKKKWEGIVKKIGEYSVDIEKMYDGVPQDIEGCIEPQNLKTYIVQTRDQLGLK